MPHDRASRRIPPGSSRRASTRPTSANSSASAPNGNLWVDGLRREGARRAIRHAALHHLRESQFRYTYRQFRDAFRSHYPDVEILFANKSNNGLAIRHIMNQEGAGGDCFGVNEMYLALLAGTNPKTLVLNGSNKQTEELEMAIQNGLCINIDAMDELDRIEAICRAVRQGGRYRHPPEARSRAAAPIASGVAMHGPGTLKEQSDSTKWGMSREQTVEIVKRAQAMKHIQLKETHFHLSRMSNDPRDFAVMAREMIIWSGYIRDKTGWTPPCIDIGGGWTFGKPYGTGPSSQLDDATAPTAGRLCRACAARRSRTRRRSSACRCRSSGSSRAARSPDRPGCRRRPGRRRQAGRAARSGSTSTSRPTTCPGRRCSTGTITPCRW